MSINVNAMSKVLSKYLGCNCFMTDCIWDRSFYEECDQGANLGRSVKGIDYVVTGHNHAPEALIVNNFYSVATCWYQEGKDWDFVLVDTTDMSLV